MFRWDSKVDTSSAEFKENREYSLGLVRDLKKKVEAAKKGGPEKFHKKLRDRNKLSARKRLELLLDRNTPFLELSTLAANGMYSDEAPCAGIITGVGVVEGREVLIIVNDPTVKGGSYFPMTIKKHIRAQEIALENRLPDLRDLGVGRLPRVGKDTGVVLA